MAITAVQTTQSLQSAQTGASASVSAMAAASDGDSEVEFTFDDLIDIINPLHHLPIISTIYRAITGDEISVHARAIGGGLYGGPIGVLAAGAVMAVEEATGLSADGMLADLFSSDDDDPQLAAKQATALEPTPEQVQAQAVIPAQAAMAAAIAPSTRLQATAQAPNGGMAQPEGRQQTAVATAEAATSASTSTPVTASASEPLYKARPNTRFFAIPEHRRAPIVYRGDQQAQPQVQAAQQAQAATQATTVSQKTTVQDTARTQGLALTFSQSTLLDRFIANSSEAIAYEMASSRARQDRMGAGTATRTLAMPRAGAQRGTAPPANADAAWFAARMQANLQKYASTQAQGVPLR